MERAGITNLATSSLVLNLVSAHELMRLTDYTTFGVHCACDRSTCIYIIILIRVEGPTTEYAQADVL